MTRACVLSSQRRHDEAIAILEELRRESERVHNAFLPYVGRLIAACRSHHRCNAQPAPNTEIAESLSAREGDILKLIARGFSNKEIGRTLAIAPETVKSHVKHIFIKLGVERRAQAVARAQSLGVVSTA